MTIELVRKVARAIFGYRSPVYRLGARALIRYEIFRREGWRAAQYLSRLSSERGNREVVLKLRSLRHPISVRTGTDDISALINNAIREEYGQFPKDFKPRVIVDVPRGDDRRPLGLQPARRV